MHNKISADRIFCIFVWTEVKEGEGFWVVPLEKKKKKSVMNNRIFVFVEVSFALFHVEMKPPQLTVTQQGRR